MEQSRLLAILCIFTLLVTFVAVVVTPQLVVGQSQSSIIEYYWQRAGAVLTSHHPDTAGVTYVLRATTFYRHVNKKGVIISTDTTVANWYYSWGKLDSMTTVGKPGVPTKKINLSYPNIFDTEYKINSFPNDNGDIALAIGFDNDSAVKTNPTGLVIINRNTYVPQWLYLYYPNVRGYKHFSRSFRFREQENFVFPDSVWEVGAIAGIFTHEYYRIETGIDSISIIR
jgi:hypothetical protein